MTEDFLDDDDKYDKIRRSRESFWWTCSKLVVFGIMVALMIAILPNIVFYGKSIVFCCFFRVLGENRKLKN